MIAKRLLQKVLKQHNAQHGTASSDLNFEVAAHYGVPFTASILTFDPIQRLLAVGTLDGRIKIIGGDNIEGLFVSPKTVPYKHLEFLHNKGFLVGVSNENEIQVWDLEFRQLVDCLQWDANITAFSVIHGTYLMYIGDENGLLSVLKYDNEHEKLLRLPYHIHAYNLAEAAGISFSGIQSVVGILPQPGTSWTRVLVAYERGLLILWDISEGLVITIKGHADLQLKGDETDSLGVGNELQGSVDKNEEEEREICSLCWISTTGSVLAVGYTNGDILLWNFFPCSSSKGKQAGISSNNVVKLQLAPGKRRLPVIVLHWSADVKADFDRGQLFIYGGDEIGSDEVLTVLSIQWSSGIETLRCTSRVRLNLSGSFADMILIPNAVSLEKNTTAALFVLTNPGQLSVYDGTILSVLKSEEGKPSAHAENFPIVVPTIDPCITVAKLCLLSPGQSSSKALLKMSFARRTPMPNLSAGTKWPLTGGVPPEMSEDQAIEKMYIVGYQDGSVRIWDATQSVLTLMFVLEGQLPIIKSDDAEAAVSALAFCSLSMTLAVGNECGLVRIYKLREGSNGSSFHFVTETNHEVHILHHGKGFHCIAAFLISKSPIRTLQFANSGDSFTAGFENGQVVLLDMTTLSIVFCTDCISKTNSPVISSSVHNIHQSIVHVGSPEQSPQSLINPTEIVLAFTKDSQVAVIDSQTGAIINSKVLQPKKESVAISMYVIDGSFPVLEAAAEKCSEPDENSSPSKIDESSSQGFLKGSDDSNVNETQEVEEHSSKDTSYASEILRDPLLILCYTDILCSYSLKSMIEGNSSYNHKVNLLKHCCWSAIFKRKSEKAPELILLYVTGVIEIRSLPGFEVLLESSLTSILRWSFKIDMNKTMSSSDDGQLALVNGSEVAFVSLMDNQSRILDSLPCLHDKVLAAAADAAMNLYADLKKRQLEELLSKVPFSDESITLTDDTELEDLSIDDIEIDDMLPAPISTSSVTKNNKTDMEKEREKLFQGSSKDTKPKVRTTQEILTQYRFAGDASAAAAHARDKLAERQERLQRLGDRTQELQNDAENFASMANELAKVMENKKWWKI